MVFLPALRRGLVFGVAALSAWLHGQQPWRGAESPVTNTLWGAVYASNRFVAVGERGTIVTSPDGVMWTARTSGTDRWLLAVTWAASRGMFIAVGDAGTILTSSDGVAWTARVSGTTQRLNSVAWTTKRFTNPDIFLAVGENGTALASVDLMTWTPCATGDTGWLRGIATLGSDSFVVTGHDGTILTTTDAGETFQRRASGTTQHLDAVALLGNDLYATGSNFALTRSTDRGVTWTLDRTVNTDGAQNGVVYNALVAFNNALVIAGDAGRLLDEFGRPWNTSEPLFNGWRAVAASSTRVVAVGTGGGIASAPIDPALGLEHTISTSFLSDTIVLTGTRRHPTNIAYRLQWFFNGEAIAGANRETLTLSTLAGAHNGTYTLTASSLDGSLQNSASITLDPEPNPAALDLVDLSFRPALAAPPGPILPLADGRVYVAGQDSTLTISDRRVNGPVRFLVDGTLDSSFAVPDGVMTGAPRAMILQPDGRLVVLEQISVFPPVFRAVRLNSNGSSDAAFRPDLLLCADGNAPALLADGRWIAVERRLNAATGGSLPFTAVLRRFLSDGSLDTSFAPIELMTASTADVSQTGSFFKGPRIISTQDAQGRIYLAVNHGESVITSLGANGGTSRLFRLRADGTLDPTFPAKDVGSLFDLAANADGVVVRTRLDTAGRLQPIVGVTTIFRITADGVRDPTYQEKLLRTERNGPTSVPIGLDRDYDVLDILPDGAIVARASGHLGHFGFVRFGKNGDMDSNFSAELGADVTAVTQVRALANGQLLVTGSFRSLLSVAQPFFARITPNARAASTRLSNVSVRARAGTGSDTLIAGYVTHGGEASVLARGVGPSLGVFGVTTVLADPQVRLFSSATEISTNDNWGNGPAAFLAATAARLGAFPLGEGSADAALYTTSPTAAYTVQVSGKNATTGIALAELYDASAPPADATSPRIVNFSVRTTASTGDDTMIVGFTLAGDNTRNVVIRAVGPGLTRFGVTDTLPDPMLTLFRGDRAVAANDDWAFTSDQRLYLLEAFKTIGAFPLESATAVGGATTSSKDAALLISLRPGSYTVQVAGKSGARGVALVEIYEVP